MRRNAALHDLSRDHHRALVVAHALRPAEPATADETREAWRRFWPDGAAHFRAEEEVLVPAYASYADPEHPLVRRTLLDHVAIRALARRLEAEDAPDPRTLESLGVRLAAHVRMEERELFPLVEQALPKAALAGLAAELEEAERRPA
jgi:hemerythrin